MPPINIRLVTTILRSANYKLQMKTEVQTADTVMPTMGNGRIRERKAEKSFLRLEMNGLSKGYKQVVDQNWGRMAKIRFLSQKPRFRAQKKTYTS